MGLIVVTIKHWLLYCNNPFLLDGIEMLHLTNCYMSEIIF